MRRVLGCFLLVASPFVAGFAQQPGPAAQPAGTYELWLSRSKAITEDLLKDSEGLAPLERSCCGRSWLGAGGVKTRPALATGS